MILAASASRSAYAVGPDGGAALSAAIRDLGGTLEGVVAASAITGIIVYCIIEVLKLPLRWTFNSLVLRSWVQRRFAASRLPLRSMASTNPSGLMPTRSRFLPADLLMKHLENRARAAMDRGGDPDELALVAAGASASDIALILNPPAMAESASRASEDDDDRPMDSPLATAQVNVAAAIERNLDELQIALSFWWPRVVQAAAILTSLVIVGSFAATVEGLGGAPMLILLIAVAGAYLAAIFRDLVGIVQRMAGR